MTSPRKKLGFLTRLLDDASPEERYKIAIDQIVLAEKLGFDHAWIAQHHFDKQEGGLPSPFVLLAAVGAKTEKITLGTAVITLSFEDPIRVLEDAAVVDILTNRRLELGVGSGATDATFEGFGLQASERRALFSTKFSHLNRLLQQDNALYPSPARLRERVWVATFSAQGAAAAGALGHGLMLSRTQPRRDANDSLAAIQHEVIDAYLAALPAGVAPRILVSRTVLAVDEGSEGQQWLADYHRDFQQRYRQPESQNLFGLNEYTTIQDAYLGTAAEVEALLAQDTVLARATHLCFQSHTVEPHYTLSNRSLEILSQQIAKNLGWIA